MTEFFRVFRKKGFEKSLSVLMNGEYSKTEFFRMLKNRKIHPNEFYRSKDDLIKLDANYNKIIYITDKGKQIFNMIEEINKILTNNVE